MPLKASTCSEKQDLSSSSHRLSSSLLTFFLPYLFLHATLFCLHVLPPSSVRRTVKDRKRRESERDSEWWDSSGLLLSDGPPSQPVVCPLAVFFTMCTEEMVVLWQSLFYEAWRRFLICLCFFLFPDTITILLLRQRQTTL